MNELAKYQEKQIVHFHFSTYTVLSVRNDKGTFRYDLQKRLGRSILKDVPEQELSLSSLVSRVSKMEATIASMNGIDTPTIERCLATAKGAIEEVLDALNTTADITGTSEAYNRANYARITLCRIRELEAHLGVTCA